MVRLGDESSVYDVDTDVLFDAPTATLRGAWGPVALPLQSPFCALPAFACTSGNDVVVAAGVTSGLSGGSYGTLTVGDGATLDLNAASIYTFCDVRVGRGATVQAPGQTTINVESNLRLGAGSRLWTPAVVDDLPLLLNVGGSLVRVSQADVIEAIITAPAAKIRLQRASELYGCFCADELTTDKNVLLSCIE
jgi:hypothetical protein